MIKKGATNFDNGLYIASSSGYLNIVKLVIKNGAKNLDEGLRMAQGGKQIKIMEKLIKSKDNQ